MSTPDAYAARPWLDLRPHGVPAVLHQRYDDILAAHRETLRRTPGAPAIHYFDGVITHAELDALSDAFALWLQAQDVGLGDRVMVILQNVPQFTIAMLGAWKAGAVPTPSNPMYREGELRKLFADCTPRVVICQRDHHQTVIAGLAAAGIEPRVLTTSAGDFRSREDERVLPIDAANVPGASDFGAALEPHHGKAPAQLSVAPGDLALLLYTSGTTGAPKGAMISHGALAFNTEVCARWFQVRDGAKILAVAPLFHITGVVAHLALGLMAGGSTVMTYRFEPSVVLDAIREHRPQLMVAAITAFIALMNQPGATSDDFCSFEALFSGGAPVPPAVVEGFAERFGKTILTSYGMTETCAPTHISPIGGASAIDVASGVLTIGIPASNVDAKIIDEAGLCVPPGEAGELLIRGPQLMAGYWNKPEETAVTLAGGWMHTGDVGFMDKAGWFYLVDRKKDMISASGFKVWPREIEDVLYSHPAIREAAVVGAPDAYRGETVKAFVSLKAGEITNADDLIAYCRTRLATYKSPRVVEILDELPKTVTGKIMRSALRT